MSSIRLHHSVDPVDSLQDKGKHGDVELFGQQIVGFIELPDVVGTVVWGERYARENDLDATGGESRDDAIKVGTGIGDSKATETIVSAKLDHHDRWFHSDDGRKPLNAVFRRVSTDAGVYDAIDVSSVVQFGLQIVRVCLSGLGSVSGGEAITEADDTWTVVLI